MIKGIILGAVLVVGLVGYGVIDTRTVESMGERVKNGVNYIATNLDEATR
jgi:hypothetical protein|tara:strand:- start:553 stop:702 length:150 start_codon:yes stop_codon:yes gene_type:complete